MTIEDTRLTAELGSSGELNKYLSEGWVLILSYVKHSSDTQRPRFVVAWQQDGPPIWVAVRQGNKAPLARAARYDGVFPVDLSGPDELAEIVDGVRRRRAPDAGPFDVAAMVGPDDDADAYEKAGATWLLTKFSPFDLTLGEAEWVVRQGAPRS